MGTHPELRMRRVKPPRLRPCIGPVRCRLTFLGLPRGFDFTHSSRKRGSVGEVMQLGFSLQICLQKLGSWGLEIKV